MCISKMQYGMRGINLPLHLDVKPLFWCTVPILALSLSHFQYSHLHFRSISCPILSLFLFFALCTFSRACSSIASASSDLGAISIELFWILFAILGFHTAHSAACALIPLQCVSVVICWYCLTACNAITWTTNQCAIKPDLPSSNWFACHI